MRLGFSGRSYLLRAGRKPTSANLLRAAWHGRPLSGNGVVRAPASGLLGGRAVVLSRSRGRGASGGQP